MTLLPSANKFANSTLVCGRFELPLTRPLLMGIVNLTADSFSGDGFKDDCDRALDYAYEQIDAGADILDIGAESTRPGAQPVPLEVELARLIPVLEKLRDCGRPISIDTSKPKVMTAVLAAGADMINDIFALTQPGALEAVAKSNCALCLMHMQGQPATMQQNPQYQEVVGEVTAFFRERLQQTDAFAIDRRRIVFDPGFGFGKTLQHNLQLFRNLRQLVAPLAVSASLPPMLIGVSRKKMLEQLTGRVCNARLAVSIAAMLAAVEKGAAIVRVHDVAATRDALTVWQALTGD